MKSTEYIHSKQFHFKTVIRTICFASLMIIIFSFILLSCGKDDTNPKFNIDRAKIKEVIYFDELSIPYDTLKYSYTSDYLISEISNCCENSRFTVSYNYENSTIIYNPYGELLTETFEMNKNGTIAEYNLFENSFELTYDKEGYLVSVKGRDRETSPQEYSFEYENGNLVKINTQLIDKYYIVIEYSNSQNKSNFTNIEEDALLRGQYFLGMTGVINKNLIKRVIYNNRDTLNYEYELNADSLVAKTIINGKISNVVKY
jgi:hypothetical protein